MVTDQKFTLVSIVMSNRRASIGNAPKQGNEGVPESWLVFRAAFQDGLSVEVGQEILVLTWLYRGDGETLSVHPRDDTRALCVASSVGARTIDRAPLGSIE